MKIEKNKIIGPLTNFKIGETAKYFIKLDNKNDIFIFLDWVKENHLDNYLSEKIFFILGGGTNILFNKFEGIVLKPEFKHLEEVEKGVLKVGSGVLISELLDYLIDLGYKGLEWAGGLPGTVGGAIEGGVGCFNGEFKNLVFDVLAFNLRTGEIKNFQKEECQFEYRNSLFRKDKEWLIVETRLIFDSGANPEELKKIAQEKINYRKEKHPLEYPNAGSVFKNYPFERAPKFVQNLALEKSKVKNDPFPVIPIAFLISELGLQGKRIGDAQVSEKHSNFIVNLGRATFNDVFQLIDFVKKSLEDNFQINPEIEIQIINHC